MDFIESRKTKRNKKHIFIVLLGIILIITSLTLFINRYYYQEKKNANEMEEIDEFLNQSKTEEIETNEVINEEDNNTTKTATNYVAVLEIPTIHLRRGLFDRNNPNNNVNRNIYMLNDTVLPDESNVSHIILASHSGNSYISYFRNLYKLDVNDEIYFYYKNIKYVYSIYKIEEVNKTGSIELKRTNNSDITLITCKGNLNKQIVVIASLKNKQNY